MSTCFGHIALFLFSCLVFGPVGGLLYLLFVAVIGWFATR